MLMETSKFLDAVAAYIVRDARKEPCRRYVVFPNKRAVIYFRGYMRRHVKDVALLPRLMTIGAFNELFAGDETDADRMELLFVLYTAYSTVAAGRGIEPMTFDRFAFWGDIMLEDFDDIDAQLADAHGVFTNVVRLNEIGSYFLDADQIEALEELWGDRIARTFTPSGEEGASEFWRHIKHHENNAGEPGVVDRFVHLWELLGDIYDEFQKGISARRLSYPGLSLRRVAENIRATTTGDLPFDHVSFVGFNRLSKSMVSVMENLKGRGVADFFWDTLPERSYTRHQARALTRLAKRFPAPADFKGPRADIEPHMEFIAVPSNFMQSKAISAQLAALKEKGELRAVRPDNTLVALPDTNLLVPLLHSLPAGIGAVNVTMGMLYRSTPFAALMRQLVSLQMRARYIRKRPHFYFDDVMDIASNPVLRRIAPHACIALESEMANTKRFNIDAEYIRSVEGLGELACVFEKIADLGDVDAVHAYVTKLLATLQHALAEAAGGDEILNAHAHEVMVLAAYAEAAERVFGYIEQYKLYGDISAGAVFGLLERVLATQAVNISGTPVTGIQVMGMLETRALDFDTVIIPSMNERVFPRRNRMRTLIPQKLRRGYGLSVSDDAEEEYAYYFFRLLARAKRVVCFYDSRVGGLGNGAPSRYLLQLKYMSETNRPRERSLLFAPGTPEVPVLTVPKDDRVMGKLAQFKDPVEGRNLSATALKAYRACKLKFYIQYVLGIRDDDEPTDFMDQALYGSVVHAVLEDLFNEQPREAADNTAIIDTAAVRRMLGHKGEILRRVEHKIEQLYFHAPDDGESHPELLNAESKLLAEQMADFVERVLKKELDSVKPPLKPFRFVAAEESFNSSGSRRNCAQWSVSDKTTVNFRMLIDRHDIMDDGTHRFVDYKTGADASLVSDVSALFSQSPSASNDAIFQLLVYARAYTDLTGFNGRIRPALYRLREAFGGNGQPFDDDTVSFKAKATPGPIVWDTQQSDVPGSWQTDFDARLRAMVDEIFDPEVPFDQTTYLDNCNYCPFRELCGRVPNTDD